MHPRCFRTMMVLAALLLLVAPHTAWAQATEAEQTALARSLFREGVSLATEERYPEAVERFRRVHELQPTPGVAYNLAAALVHTGELVEASELLRSAVASPDASAQVAEQARGLLAETEARIAHLTVRVEGATEGASLFLDGEPLRTAALGVAMPLDPGPHVVDARRGSDVVAAEEVSLDEGQAVDVTLTVPLPEVVAEPEPAPVAFTGVAAGSRSGGAEDEGSVLGAWWLWTGVAVLVTAGVLGGLYLGGAFDGPEPVTGNAMPGVLQWR